MKRWKTLIIDDEPLARLELRNLLSKYPQIEIIGDAEDVPQARNMIVKLDPDLLFLDIDLGRQTGFDLLEQLPSTFRTIFITAYDSFALRAFEVNALDYLVKPVHPERLENCICRLGSPYQSKTAEILNEHDNVLVSLGTGSKFMQIKAITCIQSVGDYTRLYSIEGYSGLVHHTLKRWRLRLPEQIFIQAHRSYIINIRHVVRMSRVAPASYIARLIYPEEPIPISRRSIGALQHRFKPERTGNR